MFKGTLCSSLRIFVQETFLNTILFHTLIIGSTYECIQAYHGSCKLLHYVKGIYSTNIINVIICYIHTRVYFKTNQMRRSSQCRVVGPFVC